MKQLPANFSEACVFYFVVVYKHTVCFVVKIQYNNSHVNPHWMHYVTLSDTLVVPLIGYCVTTLRCNSNIQKNALK